MLINYIPIKKKKETQEQKGVRKKTTLLAHFHLRPPRPSHCFFNGTERRFEFTESEVLKY